MQQINFDELKSQIEGELFVDNVQRVLYSTDASQYKEMPLAVTKPKSKEDIKKIIAFARENKTSVIPRGAGTSLAGQVVGSGIVVDMSKYMNKILEFNKEEHYVIVEPGVVLAELNLFLAKHGLQFGPETSTANRCVIGGMFGNNSCGLHSLAYGSVREHVLEVDAILSDGSETSFGSLTEDEFNAKLDNENLLEKSIYENINQILSDAGNRQEIRDNFPDPKLTRRNMGYAIDSLMYSEIFTEGGDKFNFCKLLAGSEGTLAFSTRIKLNVIPLPPKNRGLLCVHFNTLEESLQANLIALKYKPIAIELMDDPIMQAAKQNIEQSKNRFFIKGDPASMLMIEFAFETEKELTDTSSALVDELKKSSLGYHYPLVSGADKIKQVWALRTAGLGLMANIPGDRKGIPGAEDTAVYPEYLPDYIADFKKLLKELGLDSIYYAHIATGEIHFRPLINFKDPKDVELFNTLMTEIAVLVKKHKGSLSGEHGDGRVRGKFIPFMLGEKCYGFVKSVKKAWDPENIFNPGKIVDTPPITENLRVIPGKEIPEPTATFFDFSKNKGYFRSIEKCNGSGDCRKNAEIGGTMCPTFMATRDEDKSTRGRANILREFLYNNQKEKLFDHKEIYDILSLCVSCKACKSECPSNVDMAKLKAEFMQNYYDIHGVPLRSWLVGYLPRLNKLAMAFRPVSNFMMSTSLLKKTIGFSTKRTLPPLSKVTLNSWSKSKMPEVKTEVKRKVYLFNDEFTNYNESDIGIKAILLLTKLGYEVKIPKTKESGRTFLSKGMVRTSKKIATQNIMLLKDIISKETPLIGIEPSAILAFRDEYPELVEKELQAFAEKLAKRALLFEEFICEEIEKGNIKEADFTGEEQHILLHGHCQQKAVASTEPTKKMLSLPKNYFVREIPSGCCGMAGSFGYEKEHYELSMQIGEMVLFPAVREAKDDYIISAPGTSCRHHIKDGTGKTALHPVEVLYDALEV